MRRFEFSEGASNKFWEVEQVGCDVNVRYGKIGTAGQTQSKTHADQAGATVALEKLVKEKTAKGYVEVGAAPSATPAPAAKPKALAKAAPAQPQAPAASAPLAQAPVKAAAPIVYSGDTPPWLGGAPVVNMPPKLAALALPSRRFPGPAPRADANACWDLFLSKVKAHVEIRGTSTNIDYLHAVLEAQDNIAKGLQDGSRTSDAVLLAMETTYARFLTAADGAPFLDYLVASKGLAYACDTFILMQEKVAYDENYNSATGGILTFIGCPARPLAKRWKTEFSPTEFALRSHLAHAAEELWTECSLQLKAAIPRLPLSRQPVICALLPELPELADQMGLAQGGASAPDAMMWLLLTARSPAAVRKLRLNKPHEWYTPLGFYNSDVAMATLVQELGVDAVPMLEDGAIIEEAARALASIGTVEALSAMARASSHSKDCLQRFSEAARRWPLASVAALCEIIGADASAASAFGTVLATHARASIDALPAIKPWLSPKAALVLDKQIEKFDAPLEVADATELPPVLANPPWKGKPKKKAAALTLEPLALAAVERWPDGEREAALHLEPTTREALARAGGDPLALAKMLGFRHGAFLEPAVAAITAADASAFVNVWINSWRERRGHNAHALAHLPTPMAAEVWRSLAEGDPDAADYIVARLGLAGVPGLLTMIDMRPIQELPRALPFGAVELAAPVARAYVKQKKIRHAARQWLLAYPEHAAAALIAPALGKPGEARDCAGVALRLLAAQGHSELLMAVALRYRQPEVAQAMRSMLDEDPLDLHPPKIAPLPAFWSPLGWSRPILSSNGKALPDDALEHVGVMMRFPIAGPVYAGITQLKQAFTEQSLANFAWDAFQAWIDSGAPSKEGWVFMALGLLGNDDTARKLVPLMRAWPSEGQHTRAVSGLEVLAMIGNDTALMLLHGIAQKAKSRPLQISAREKIDQVAVTRELTSEELEDRIAPDLGLDEMGTLELDFGARRFRVGFDEALKPYVRDQDGARLPDLPKPKQSDDEQLSTAALERFKRLKRDARTIAAQQVLRLEVAMCVRRRWECEVFRTFLAGHPLVRNLVQRLVWGVYRMEAQTSFGGTLLGCFRVAPDGTWTDSGDDAFQIPDGGDISGEIRIGIPHALDLPVRDAAAFGQLFADYELLQPFAQIGRDTHALAPDETANDKLTRWADATVSTKSVLGLASKGWHRGAPQDHGFIWSYTKELGQGQLLELTLEPGISAAEMEMFKEQKVIEVRTGKADRFGGVGKAAPMSTLHPIAASELIRDLSALRR